MTNHPNRAKTAYTLRALIDEYYTANESKFFGFADRGNGSGFGEAGHCIPYDDAAAAAYGDIVLAPCKRTYSADEHSAEFNYKSHWQDGDNGYQFRVMF